MKVRTSPRPLSIQLSAAGLALRPDIPELFAQVHRWPPGGPIIRDDEEADMEIQDHGWPLSSLTTSFHAERFLLC